MTHWFEVFRYELRQAFRRKAYLFITFGVPLIAIVAFFGYQFYQDNLAGDGDDDPATPVEEVNESDQVIGYVDNSAGGLFPAPESYAEVDCTLQENEIDALLTPTAADDPRSQVVKRIASPYCMSSLINAYDSFAAGEAALEDGDIDLLAVIEPDFAETGNVSIYVESLNLEAMDSQALIEDYILRSLLYNVEAADYEALYLRLRDPAAVTAQTLTESGETETENEDQNFILVYAFGIISMFGIFWGGGYLMQSVVQEKESRIVEIVLSSVEPTALLFGKVMAQGLAAIIQVGIVAGTFVFLGTQAGEVFSGLGDLDISTTSLIVLAVYFVLGFLMFGSLMAAIGALSTSVREAQNFVVVVTLPAAVPFFFLTFFAEEPNGTLARFLSLFPLTAPLSMIMRRSITDVPLGEMALSVALLIAAIGGAIWFAGRLFRVNILLSGSMPKFKDIPKLLRG